ncbi:MAG: response regulator, partial [Rhodomicrobium sp.]
MVDQPQLKGIRVLVVEDDDLSSLVAQEMLVELGCVVTGAERSVDGALATLENDGPFDCVMLDVR